MVRVRQARAPPPRAACIGWLSPRAKGISICGAGSWGWLASWAGRCLAVLDQEHRASSCDRPTPLGWHRRTGQTSSPPPDWRLAYPGARPGCRRTQLRPGAQAPAWAGNAQVYRFLRAVCRGGGGRQAPRIGIPVYRILTSDTDGPIERGLIAQRSRAAPWPSTAPAPQTFGDLRLLARTGSSVG